MGVKKKKTKSPPMALVENSAPELDDDGLLDDIVAQIDVGNTSQHETATVVQQVETNKAEQIEATSGKKDSKARFEARKLRRAAEQAALYTNDNKDADARLEQEARHEEQIIKAVCDDLGLVMYEINPDGHCLYAAVADQLRILNVIPPAHSHYATTRAAAAHFMATHPDEFLPFLPSTEGEDGAGAGDAGLMAPHQFRRYCENVRDSGMWGGEPEILALSRAYGVPIHVVQSGNPTIVVHDPNGNNGAPSDDKRVVRISYHRRMYGLGEHYNSLRPKSFTQQLKSIF